MLLNNIKNSSSRSNQFSLDCFQCFDAVGWCQEEHPVHKNLGDEVIRWSEVQIACIWFSWCHCHPIMSALAKSRMVYPSGTNSPGKSRTKGRKTVVVVVVVVADTNTDTPCYSCSSRTHLILYTSLPLFITCTMKHKLTVCQPHKLYINWKRRQSNWRADPSPAAMTSQRKSLLNVHDLRPSTLAARLCSVSTYAIVHTANAKFKQKFDLDLLLWPSDVRSVHAEVMPWTISLSSLVLITPAIFLIECGNKRVKTDRQTHRCNWALYTMLAVIQMAWNNGMWFFANM